MQFTPQSEEEVQANRPGPWPKGEYDFEVIEAAEKQSKSGNDMIELQVTVFNAEGKQKTIKDWLLGTPSTIYKLRHFAYGSGLEQEYEAGTLEASDCIRRTGKVTLRIEKDPNGQYADKNVIQDYVIPENKQASAKASEKKTVFQKPVEKKTGEPSPFSSGDHRPVEEEDIPF